MKKENPGSREEKADPNLNGKSIYTVRRKYYGAGMLRIIHKMSIK